MKNPRTLNLAFLPFAAPIAVRGSGDPKAVTIVEFADFNCEYCRLTYQELKKAFATTNTPIRFIWRTFPIDLSDPRTLVTASAAHCANQQQKFWDIYDRLFTMINPTTESIVKLANEAKLNVTVFEQCLNSPGRLQALQADLQNAKDHNITGAPTLFVGKQTFNGFVSAEEIRAAVIQEYQR